MKKWIVEAGDLIMSVWTAETAEAALDAYAKEAGYESFESLQKEVPGDVRVYAYEELDSYWQARIREQYPDLF